MKNNVQSGGNLKFKKAPIIMVKYEKFNTYHIFWAFFTNNQGPTITRSHLVSWLTHT